MYKKKAVAYIKNLSIKWTSLRKTTKIPRQDNKRPVRYTRLSLIQHKRKALPLQPSNIRILPSCSSDKRNSK